MSTRHVVLALTLTLPVLLSGCIVEPAQPRPYYGGGYAEVVAPQAPPEYVEDEPAPRPGYIWIGGFFHWNGRAYERRPGHWEAARAGYHYVRPHYERSRDGWHERSGSWERN